MNLHYVTFYSLQYFVSYSQPVCGMWAIHEPYILPVVYKRLPENACGCCLYKCLSHILMLAIPDASARSHTSAFGNWDWIDPRLILWCTQLSCVLWTWAQAYSSTIPHLNYLDPVSYILRKMLQMLTCK